MCTCPNYMILTGETYVDKDMKTKPKYRFIGHHQFNKFVKTDHRMLFIEVPCGTCLECRIQNARQWADRCVLEAQQYKYNYFVTLTYDDYFLPAKNSLEPRDLQLFLKRLRKKFKGTKIRFLASGEYGDSSFRPHYHLILFNCPIDDLTYMFERQEVIGEHVEFKNDKDGNPVAVTIPHYGPYLKYNLEKNTHDMMFSKTIYELWHKGNISVQTFNYDTAAYVSQYVTKKCNPNMKKVYQELGIVPEFLRVSNRPGLAASYFEAHDYCHTDGKLVIPCSGEAHLSAVPRYFDKLFIKKYGDDIFDSIRVKRAKDRNVTLETYLHSPGADKDKQNSIRSYNTKKRQRLREAI